MTALLNYLIKSGIDIYVSKIIDDWYEIDTESDLKIYHSMIENNNL